MRVVATSVSVTRSSRLASSLLGRLSVGPARCIDPRRNEETVTGQFGDAWAFDQHVEDIAEAATVAPTGRCGKADEDRVGVFLEKSLIGGGAGVMAFVNEHQIGFRQVDSPRPHSSSMQRLD